MVEKKIASDHYSKMDNLERLEFFNALVESCLLPRLNRDFDVVPLNGDNFIEYHKMVKENLPKIYDFLTAEGESEQYKIKSKIIIMLCELTGPGAVYKLEDDGILLKNAENLLTHYTRQYSGVNTPIDKLILEYYCERLRPCDLKRNLGAIHGFIKFISVYLSERNFSPDWSNFVISVAVTLRECPGIHKHLAIKAFQVVLEKTKKEDIRTRNIHGVIFSNVFKDIYNMESPAMTYDIWQCLFKCLDFFNNITSLEWSPVDDMIEVLLHNIPLTSNAEMSLCYLEFLTKLCYYLTINRQEISDNLKLDLYEEDNLQKCFHSCKRITCSTGMRWAKNVLELLNIESYKIMQDTRTSVQTLKEMHRCYMVCIVPVPLGAMEPILRYFLDKFTSSLLQAIVTHNKEIRIVALTNVFIETFSLQLMTAEPLDEKKVIIHEFKKAFDALLKHPTFQN